jgi:hypothetical protein
MRFKDFNWPIWTGFLLTIASFVSYPTLFVRFSSTRDFPWATLLLFGISLVFLLIGIRRAFSSSSRALSKVLASLFVLLSVLILGTFIFTFFVVATWLPASKGAPQVGQKAPEFSLTDTNGRQVSLAELLSSPINGKAPRGVLLVFYRGYW